jgi:xylan 1,4-beta-xylosidase
MKKLWLAFLMLSEISFGQSATEKVNISVDLNKEQGQFSPAWAWFGHDEPNYTYMKDGKKLLKQLAELSPTPVYMRVHNLLTTGDGTASLKWGSTNAYTEDQKGNPVYDWTIIDRIFDTYMERGMKPFVEIGFMPEAMSIHPDPYRHSWTLGAQYNNIYTGWTYPPKDYQKWAELIYQWVKHSVDRYGRKEVETWYWEVWNEPDIKYWGGTFEEFCKLYDYSADAVKRALPTAKTGGPETTNPGSANAGKFLKDFLEHCSNGTNYVTGKIGSPLDFISFHAKGSPVFVEGMVRMDMGKQLNHVNTGFEIVAGHPKYKNLPIIIGECDPEGCAACGMTIYPQNGYRNGTMYSSYTAASFAKIYDLARYHKINLLGIVSWSFEFEDQPWFHGFRDLSTNGTGKPVLNVFRMFGMMGNTRVEAVSNGGIDWKAVIESGVRKDKSDIGVLATKGKDFVSVMIWNYHDDDKTSTDSEIILKMNGLKFKKAEITRYLIDRDNSNSYEVWKKMGSPQNPDPEQIKRLEEAGMLHLSGTPALMEVKNNSLSLETSLQRQGVQLIIIRGS